MTITELLADPARRSYAAMPETDALTDADSLQEAELAELHFDARGSVLAMLFDLRNALQFRLANTAVLAVREVERLEWSASEPVGLHRSAHYVMSSTPSASAGRIMLEIGCLGGWRIAATALQAEFFVGNVPGLPEAPPNFVEDDEATIAAGMPSWGSRFEVGWATFIDGSD